MTEDFSVFGRVHKVNYTIQQRQHFVKNHDRIISTLEWKWNIAERPHSRVIKYRFVTPLGVWYRFRRCLSGTQQVLYYLPENPQKHHILVHLKGRGCFVISFLDALQLLIFPPIGKIWIWCESKSWNRIYRPLHSVPHACRSLAADFPLLWYLPCGR